MLSEFLGKTYLFGCTILKSNILKNRKPIYRFTNWIPLFREDEITVHESLLTLLFLMAFEKNKAPLYFSFFFFPHLCCKSDKNIHTEKIFIFLLKHNLTWPNPKLLLFRNGAIFISEQNMPSATVSWYEPVWLGSDWAGNKTLKRFASKNNESYNCTCHDWLSVVSALPRKCNI